MAGLGWFLNGWRYANSWVGHSLDEHGEALQAFKQFEANVEAVNG
jgi:hypothetical protein